MLEIADMIRKIEMVFMHAMRPLIQEAGFNKTEMMILMSVFHKRAFRMTDLAKMSDVPTSTFTGVIDRLEKKGFITRENDPDDRRSVLIRGTPLLQETVGELMRRFNESLEEFFRHVPPELLQETTQNLKKIYEYVKEAAPGHDHCMKL